jgi:hypothetical protein
MIVFGIFIIWIVYTLLEGVIEANSKHLKSCLKIRPMEIKYPIHWIQRFLFLGVLYSLLLSKTGFITSIFGIISMILVFPFICDETYSCFRKKMLPNETEYSKIFISKKIKINLCVAGILLQILILIL